MMLVLILLLELPLLIFLIGVLVIAYGVTLRHGDPSATYQLYAVRDRLVEAAVREQRRIQRQKAKDLLQMMRGGPYGCPA